MTTMMMVNMYNDDGTFCCCYCATFTDIFFEWMQVIQRCFFLFKFIPEKNIQIRKQSLWMQQRHYITRFLGYENWITALQFVFRNHQFFFMDVLASNFGWLLYWSKDASVLLANTRGRLFMFLDMATLMQKCAIRICHWYF